jgi:hypothetical protein
MAELFVLVGIAALVAVGAIVVLRNVPVAVEIGRQASIASGY